MSQHFFFLQSGVIGGSVINRVIFLLVNYKTDEDKDNVDVWHVDHSSFRGDDRGSGSGDSRVEGTQWVGSVRTVQCLVGSLPLQPVGQGGLVGHQGFSGAV